MSSAPQRVGGKNPTSELLESRGQFSGRFLKECYDIAADASGLRFGDEVEKILFDSTDVEAANDVQYRLRLHLAAVRWHIAGFPLDAAAHAGFLVGTGQFAVENGLNCAAQVGSGYGNAIAWPAAVELAAIAQFHF